MRPLPPPPLPALEVKQHLLIPTSSYVGTSSKSIHWLCIPYVVLTSSGLICSEKDLDEVVQTTTIFANVSKGVLAKHEDLQLVFGSTNQDKVCRIILADGEMQACSMSQPSIMHQPIHIVPV